MLASIGLASTALRTLGGLLNSPSGQTKPAQRTSLQDFYGMLSGVTPSAPVAPVRQVDRSSGSGTADLLQGLFNDLDVDGSGGISIGEFVGQLGAGGTNEANARLVYGAIDRNGDGQVTQEEMTDGLKRADGKVNAASLQAIQSYLAMQRTIASQRSPGFFA